MKGMFALFVHLILILAFTGSGFSQTALFSGNRIDRKISSFQTFSRSNDLSALKVGGFLTGRITEIGPQSIEVETRSGMRRSYLIEPSIRFEKLQEAIKGLKKGDTVRLELARRGMGEFITAIEKAE